MARTPAGRTTLLGAVLVVVGSALPSKMVPPWDAEAVEPWLGPAGHLGLFLYDYAVLGFLLVALAVFLSATARRTGSLALAVGGVLILLLRGWYVSEAFGADFSTSNFTVGWGVYVSAAGALLLVVAGIRLLD